MHTAKKIIQQIVLHNNSCYTHPSLCVAKPSDLRDVSPVWSGFVKLEKVFKNRYITRAKRRAGQKV